MSRSTMRHGKGFIALLMGLVINYSGSQLILLLRHEVAAYLNPGQRPGQMKPLFCALKGQLKTKRGEYHLIPFGEFSTPPLGKVFIYVGSITVRLATGSPG